MITGWAFHELYMWHDTGIDDPRLAIVSDWPGQVLQPHQRAAIDQAATAVAALRMRC